MSRKIVLLLVPMIFVLASCGSRKAPLTAFADAQRDKVVEKSFSREAESLYWVAFYEPTTEDMQALRSAWNEHSKAFPESKAIQEIEKVMKAPGEKALLVSVYTSDVDKADIMDKSLGWSLSPVPQSIKELQDSDQVLRVLFPVKNTWARYFLLRYVNPIWSDSFKLTVGKPEGSVELERNK